MENYRPLLSHEIAQLKAQGCQSGEWEKIFIASEQSIPFISNAVFSGKIIIGTFSNEHVFSGGVKKHSGIYNAHIHNCTIESNCYINNIHQYIANYHIRKNAIIENVDSIYCDPESQFGNGVIVSPLNEGGGREIPIYNKLSAQVAFILCKYRKDEELIKRLQKIIQNYCQSQSSNIGTIEQDCIITNSGQLSNVYLQENTLINGASLINNCTINTASFIGQDVIIKDSIIGKGSTISNGAIITKCFIGECCTISYQFSAENSLFFSNSEALHGEACNVFAGPFTVTHHKSTLLIAGQYSFFNAGSGANQSNHMYRLGPIHQGILERGCKMGSDAYILWPAKIGAFTLIAGRHYQHSDTSNFPFSYLIESNRQSHLIPGINLKSIGTYRDGFKWPQRDKRDLSDSNDFIHFSLFNPYTIQKIKKGKDLLKQHLTKNENKGHYCLDGTIISDTSAQKGISLYKQSITCYLGEILSQKLINTEIANFSQLKKILFTPEQTDHPTWIDTFGLICSTEKLDQILTKIKSKQVDAIETIQEAFNELFKSYNMDEWKYCLSLLHEEKLLNTSSSFTKDNLENFLSLIQIEATNYYNSILIDSEKEFTDEMKISYDNDFEMVRRKLEHYPTIKHLKEKLNSINTNVPSLIKKIRELPME